MVNKEIRSNEFLAHPNLNFGFSLNSIFTYCYLIYPMANADLYKFLFSLSIYLVISICKKNWLKGHKNGKNAMKCVENPEK